MCSTFMQDQSQRFLVLAARKDLGSQRLSEQNIHITLLCNPLESDPINLVFL